MVNLIWILDEATVQHLVGQQSRCMTLSVYGLHPSPSGYIRSRPVSRVCTPGDDRQVWHMYDKAWICTSSPAAYAHAEDTDSIVICKPSSEAKDEAAAQLRPYVKCSKRHALRSITLQEKPRTSTCPTRLETILAPPGVQ